MFYLQIFEYGQKEPLNPYPYKSCGDTWATVMLHTSWLRKICKTKIYIKFLDEKNRGE